VRRVIISPLYVQAGKMARDARLNVRINQKLKDKAILIAEDRGVTLSELVTDLLKQLPEPSRSD
jgi:predicted HicB family RNase H-like nuclease